MKPPKRLYHHWARISIARKWEETRFHGWLARRYHHANFLTWRMRSHAHHVRYHHAGLRPTWRMRT